MLKGSTTTRTTTILKKPKTPKHSKRVRAISQMTMALEILNGQALAINVIMEMGVMEMMTNETMTTEAKIESLVRLQINITKVNLATEMTIMIIIVKTDPKVDSLEDVMTLVTMIGRMTKTIEETAMMEVVADATVLATLVMKTLILTPKCTSLDLTERQV